MAELRALLLDATRALGGDSARLEAELLLAHAIDRPRAWLYAHAEDVPTPAQAAAFAALVARRAAGEPVAYLVGARDFWSLRLRVTPDTLIPRAETELLVEQALERLPRDAAWRVADLGTGSGAVALSLARERPRAEVWATDRSGAALAVAQANALAHGLEHVRFAEGDWCAALPAEPFDLIVSNPPYIAEGDAHLRQGDLRFEPADALASGRDGLTAIRQIVDQARECLRPGAALLLEHGVEQGTAVRQILGLAGYRDAFTAQDLESRDRVSGARWPG
jgi:release factor glutamine methyltransferase